jgi:hypothetical protein
MASDGECVSTGFVGMMARGLFALDVSALVTFLSAIGAVIAWTIDKRFGREQERRQTELVLIERQLRELYGPLFATVSASKQIHEAFKAHAGVLATRIGTTYSTSDFRDGTATKEVATLHRQWCTAVMCPQWEEIERRIRDNGDLVIEAEFPAAFVKMLTHIASWQLLTASWEGTNTSKKQERSLERSIASISFPAEFREYVSAAYARLRRRQHTLLSELHPRGVRDGQKQ